MRKLVNKIILITVSLPPYSFSVMRELLILISNNVYNVKEAGTAFSAQFFLVHLIHYRCMEPVLAAEKNKAIALLDQEI